MTAPPRPFRGMLPAVGVLAALAYLPALLAAPGRMPADSKLYLYLDPGRFLADAAGSFDPRQFAGWVPHQHVAYLWPTGPWFWIFERVGVPDWLAHRLWIGTVMLAAGLGVRWCARLLGLTATGALAAALVYQISPYVLPYVSRTSVMLLPWAGVGWIVALTVRASRRHSWGDPAAIALVVLTVGAVNATALAMIVPAPVLWLVHTAWQGGATWRQVTAVALRTTVLTIGTSLWWIVMLVLQARHGTDVLPYSESLADVSLTATAPEVWRSLGYWLFYVRDPYAATTTESLRYLVSTPAIVVSFLVPLAGLAGLFVVRWAHRRFAALLVVAGGVLAVGVHPLDDRPPLVALLTGDGDGGLALALRSSTRALPVMQLGMALAVGALVAAGSSLVLRIRERELAADHLALIGAAVLVVANMPALWTGAWVDPALERDQRAPDAWLDAAEALDSAPEGARVLQLPGAEFGAFRWGYTVDQPLPGLTERAVVTRDLLPLGSAAAMDLVFALDDRVQAGIAEPAAIAPLARLLGVDTIWLADDAAFERFRTARPEIVRDLVLDAPGIGTAAAFGEPTPSIPDVPMLDGRALGDPRVGRPIPTVELAPVLEPGAVVRAATEQVVVSGSGDGLVDASAAGLLDHDRLIRYSAAIEGSELSAALRDAEALIVTDSNRSEARHWRSSQDTRGATETRDPDLALLRDVPSDQRLPVFEGDDPDARTHVDQRGQVRATATSYGEPFAYLPEHRPVMAIDGDPATAWLVGEHADPIGETLRLAFSEPVGELVLHQPTGTPGRSITAITVDDGDGAPVRRVELDDRSRDGTGQPVAVTGETVDLTIAAVGGGVPGTAGAVAGVGFSEIGHGRGPTREVVRPPHDALAVASAETPTAIVLTRLRADPMNRWRDDPEPTLVRELDLPVPRRVDVAVDVRIDPRAPDADLAGLFGWPVVASTRLTGAPRHAGAAAFDGDRGTAWISAFGTATGATLTIEGPERPIDRIELRQPPGPFSRITALRLRAGGDERLVDVAADAEGRAELTFDPLRPDGRLEMVVETVEPATTVDRRFGDIVELPVAIAEVAFEDAPRSMPPGSTPVELPCTPLISVGEVAIAVALRIEGDGWLQGRPIAATACDATVTLPAGPLLVTAAETELPVTIDRLVLDDRAGAALARPADRPLATVRAASRFARTVEVDDCATGCWLVLGEGFNRAWSASVGDEDLGPPRLVDGGFNGWRLAPSADPVVVELRWTAQRPLTIALVLTALSAAAALVVAVADRRRRAGTVAPSESLPGWAIAPGRLDRRTAVLGAAVWVVSAGLLVGPGWALPALLGGAAMVLGRHARLGELTALVTVAVVGAAIAYLERRDAPFPGGGWPSHFDRLHGVGMFAFASLLVGALVARDAGDRDAGADVPAEMPADPG